MLFHLRRFCQLLQGGHIDRDGEIADMGSMVTIPDATVFEVNMGVRQVDLTGADEVQPIFTSLET